ncbi:MULTISPECIES: hypothetical protein [Vibrio]|uniref:DUF2946 domain-containing protein n=1 Tax=Vibrio tasmaniensis TaxID=212663 RepID=A0AB38NUA9_9VIBR|nr:hypothetical protein [Vibrio tasmaniensis]TKG34597.1 hypothetical protein FC057_08805 [Vibrio tasmaniensis]TKG42896.1 hypothetical protein FC063_04870 [Vibrio tasmaniensis]TKG52237.1 hypothetical protein FC061_10335 [Vibrio tasmaniensis]TKG53533.1 hypothetical protein FC060_00945 [Vibrio tasmaniensis]TKG55154.1 hypothetical protein FC070_02455 [Vibrio tasmaniensis]
MPKLISKIWVHAFMLFAMLVATVSVDSIANANAMQVTQNQSTLSLNTDSSFDTSDSFPYSSAQPNVEHHCCGSVCLLKMPPLIVSESFDTQIGSLALIEKEPSHKAIMSPQAPYRPPIS